MPPPQSECNPVGALQVGEGFPGGCFGAGGVVLRGWGGGWRCPYWGPFLGVVGPVLGVAVPLFGVAVSIFGVPIPILGTGHPC